MSNAITPYSNAAVAQGATVTIDSAQTDDDSLIIRAESLVPANVVILSANAGDESVPANTPFKGVGATNPAEPTECFPAWDAVFTGWAEGKKVTVQGIFIGGIRNRRSPADTSTIVQG